MESLSPLPSWFESEVSPLATSLAKRWSRLFETEVRVQPTTAPTRGSCRLASPIAHSQTESFWELDWSLAAMVVDVQTGAQEMAPSRAHGKITEVEKSLIGRAMRVVRDVATESFDSRVALDVMKPPRALADQSVSTLPSSELILHEQPHPFCVALRVHFMQAIGTLMWWIAPEHIQPLAPVGQPSASQQWTAVLAELEFLPNEIHDLAVGDVIQTDLPVDTLVQVHADDGPPLQATLGQVGRQRAVRLHA